MSTTRLIALANQTAGRDIVRSIRVLPPGTHTAAPTADAAPDTAPGPTGPARTSEDASADYRQALAVLQTAKAEQGDRLPPAVRAAIERQLKPCGTGASRRRHSATGRPRSRNCASKRPGRDLSQRRLSILTEG